MRIVEELVSIIIPAYNLGNYLEECLESIVRQTYKNFEVILVNDGSVDNTDDICLSWAKKYTNIQYFHNDNHGVSYTRNFAIDKCKGEYVVFIDADDIVGENYLTVLHNLFFDDIDLSMVSYYGFKDEEPYHIEQRKYSSEITVLDKNLESAFFTITQGTICSKMYRTEILKKHNIRFDENISVSEDLLFNFDYVHYCRRIAYVPYKLYGYRQRTDSAVHNSKSKKWFTCLDVYSRLRILCRNTDIYPTVLYYYLKFLYEGTYIIRHQKLNKMEIRPSIDQEIKVLEQEKNKLTLQNRLKLFVCKYFFFVVAKRR